ncbi:hypothetical protein HDU83_008546 [Entophlyctis luteolus]|nr:hypothetical protein HDU83_008546 [Entophlyctis luteolus]
MGGADHILRLRNPHRLRNAIASFKGQSAPIIDPPVNEATSARVLPCADLGHPQAINDAESAQSPNDSLNRILFLPHSVSPAIDNVAMPRQKM